MKQTIMVGIKCISCVPVQMHARNEPHGHSQQTAQQMFRPEGTRSEVLALEFDEWKHCLAYHDVKTKLVIMMRGYTVANNCTFHH